MDLNGKIVQRLPLGLVLFSSLFTLFPAGAATAAEDGRTLECRPEFEPAGPGYAFLDEAGAAGYQVPPDAVIGEVHYTRLNVFNLNDPDENNALYRWANRVHVLTREPVIERQVLFAPGQPFDARRLRESARILRRQDNFFDADVRAVSLCGNRVDVEVITRDTWSFTPSLSFDRSGGDNTYSFLLEESNLLGRGKQIRLEASHEIDRDTLGVLYQDNNLLGTRMALETAWVEADDGSDRLLSLGLPFFSLESRRAWNLRLQNLEREDRQFRRGDEVSEMNHEIADYSIEYGISNGLAGGWARRLSAGLRLREDRFSPTADLPPPAVFPSDRELNQPYLKLELIEDDFTTAFNFDRLYRTEDLHLGLRLSASLGYAATGLGSDQDRLVLEGILTDTLLYNGDELLEHGLEWEGLWNLDDNRGEDVLATYNLRYFHRQTRQRSFYASLETVYSENLNSHRQVVMGGLDGTRGFRNRLQTGDRSVALSLEERIYTDIHLFNLIRVGGAVFFDAGRVWADDGDIGTEEDWLVDAGFGLRLASSKASSNRILHLDFAFPLTNRDDPEVDNVLVAVNIKSAF